MNEATTNVNLPYYYNLFLHVFSVRCGVSNRSHFLLQISITEDGSAANFTRSFAMKSGYYLCYSKVTRTETQYTQTILHVCFPAAPCSLHLSLLPFINGLYMSLSAGPGRWYGSVRHSAYFRQGIYSSRLLLHSRAP